MHLILTGATGLVGTAVLHHILSLPTSSPAAQKITRLSIISRRSEIPLLIHPDRPKQNNFTRVEVLEHKDFSDYDKDGLLDKIKSENDNERIAVIWALGVSSTLVASEEKYDEITRIYPIEAIKALTKLQPKQLNFVYVSGEGAKPKPGFMTPMFGRVKGRTETELLELMKSMNELKVYNVRPGEFSKSWKLKKLIISGGVDPGAEPEQKLVNQLSHTQDGGTGGSTRGSLSFKAMEIAFLPVMRSGIYKGMHSPTAELATVLVDLAIGDGEAVHVAGSEADGRTLPNVALRRLGGGMK